MPLLIAGDQRIVGFDPDALEGFVSGLSGRPSPAYAPPGNSLEEVNEFVVDPGPDVASGLRNLLERIDGEMSYNDAKGQSAFRAGVHDGLRFAWDALQKLLQHHESAVEAEESSDV